MRKTERGDRTHLQERKKHGNLTEERLTERLIGDKRGRGVLEETIFDTGKSTRHETGGKKSKAEKSRGDARGREIEAVRIVRETCV